MTMPEPKTAATTPAEQRALARHALCVGKPYEREILGAGLLDRVLALDASLWAATSAPIASFRCDPDLLRLLDTDGNGRVRIGEVKAAARWVQRVCKADLGDTAPAIRLEVLRVENADGEALAQAARRVLDWSGSPEAETVTLDTVRGYLGKIASLPLNGDGVLVSAAARDEPVAVYLRDVLDATGGTADASGATGVNEAQLDAFDAAVGDYLEWLALAETEPENGRPHVLPFGKDTAELHGLVDRLAARVEHYFALSAALAFDRRLAVSLTQGRAAEVDLMSAATVGAFLEDAPLARPAPQADLPLEGPDVNPRYRADLVELRRVCTTVLGRVVGPELTVDAWRETRARLAPYAAYVAGKRGGWVEAIPRVRLEGYRDGAQAVAARRLLEADRAVAAVVGHARDLERLLVYKRSLPRLINNFVSFYELYDLSKRAMFEMGSAVIDGRWFNLAVRVEDVSAHAALAKAGNLFTLYLEVKAADPETVMTVAVPATSGSRGNVTVGKRGVFFDIDGREYDARVIQIIENPISLREALVAPFVRLWGFVVGRIEAMSGASEKDLQAATDRMMQSPSPGAAAAPAAPAMSGMHRSGMLVGLSVSLAAIGSAFAFVAKTLSSMTRGQVALSLLGTLGAVLAPVFLIAVLKLWRQDLSVLLEGCGWAINSRMRLTRGQRRQFTQRLSCLSRPRNTPRRLGIFLAWVLIALVVTLAYCATERWIR